MINFSFILVSLTFLSGCGAVAKVSPTCASAAIAKCHQSIDACFVDENNNSDRIDQNSK